MGCLSLQFLKACTTGSSKIKVMTIDGRCLKYATPSIVKEVLMEHPLHMLFDAQTVRTLGDRARPLRSTFSLRPGHIYFLVPQPTRRSQCACETVNYDSLRSTALTGEMPLAQESEASLQSDLTHMKTTECSKPKRKVSFATEPVSGASKGTNEACLQFLPSPSEGVVRIKMVVSKRQLAGVLRGGGDCVSVVEGLLSPLLKGGSEPALSAYNDISSYHSWRPSLESIPESYCHRKGPLKDAEGGLLDELFY